MKKLIPLLILTFIICLSHFALSQQYGWTDISKNLPNLPYDTIFKSNGDTLLCQHTDVCFINDNEGWVTSWQLTSVEDSAVIFHTSDGGENWDVQYVYSNMNNIWMLNSQTGYAGSQDGLIYATHDGGQNWDFHAVVGGPVRDMYFPPNSDTGFVCCDLTNKYYVIKPVGVDPYGLPNPDFWEGICATTDGVWICGGGSIILMKDGIINWQSASSHGYWTSIFFINENYGWAGNSGYIDGFIDPDIPWSIVLDTDDTHSYCIHAIDKDHVWAVLLDGRIMHTENGSEYGFDTITSYMWSDVEWETQPQPHPNSALLAIQFTSLNTGYTVGHNNVVLKYTKLSAIKEEMQNIAFDLFPNPAKNKFKISSSEFLAKICKIELHDLYGQILIEKQIATGHQKAEIDVSNLASGVYFCTMKTDKKSSTKKLIIE